MENLVTRKIKAIIIFWVVCNLFETVLGSVASEDGNFDFFGVLNCSCNIIFYYLFDAKFKLILKSFFCRLPSSQQGNANATKDHNVKMITSTGCSNEIEINNP